LPDEILGDTCRALFLICQLLMCCGCRGDDQGLCIAHIGQMGRQLNVIDKACAGCGASLDTKGQDCTESMMEDLLGMGMRRVRGESRVRDPFNTWVVLQVLSQTQCIVNRSLDSKRQGFQTCKKMNE